MQVQHAPTGFRISRSGIGLDMMRWCDWLLPKHLAAAEGSQSQSQRVLDRVYGQAGGSWLDIWVVYACKLLVVSLASALSSTHLR